MILMALSNEHGHLVLTTGNKSELATGYSTLYGDSAGGFAPIKDVLKTLVWELSRWRNAAGRRARRDAADPGELDHQAAERRAAPRPARQRLAARLRGAGPAARRLRARRTWARAELIAAGHDPALVERVIRLVDRAEYKRRQYPPGPKITAKNFGRDRRLPITSRWRESLPPQA